MISGVVNANREATVPLVVLDANGEEHEIEGVIDTGFSGYLTIPVSLVGLLGLPWLGREDGMLADGSVQVFDVYEARVSWDGQPRTIEADAAEGEPLVGMGLMHGYDVRIEVIEGGRVAIEAISSG